MAEGDQSPLREIIHAVGGLSCSQEIYSILPILAGIQGPLEDMFRDANYSLFFAFFSNE